MKKILLSLFAILLTISVIGCEMPGSGTGTGNGGPSLSQKAGITVEEVGEILIGEKHELDYTLNLISGEVTFESSNKKIAIVDAEGVVTAVAKGTAVITITCVTEDKTYDAQVEIVVVEEEPVHEHVACPECGKCTAEDCDGAEEEKCAGHPVHEHQVCPECQKCLDPECEGEKCEGHVAAPVETTYTLDCVSTFGNYASAWDTTYTSRTITFAQLGVADLAGQLVLSNANKQADTITDRPVMASKSSATQYATLTVETGTISSVTFTLAQWTTKKFKTLTIEYTTDGSTWVATNVGITNGSAEQADAHSPLTATLPEGVIGVRFAFLGSTNKNNQIGLTSVEFTHEA